MVEIYSLGPWLGWLISISILIFAEGRAYTY